MEQVIDITFHFTRTDLEESGSILTLRGDVAGAAHSPVDFWVHENPMWMWIEKEKKYKVVLETQSEENVIVVEVNGQERNEVHS